MSWDVALWPGSNLMGPRWKKTSAHVCEMWFAASFVLPLIQLVAVEQLCLKLPCKHKECL